MNYFIIIRGPLGVGKTTVANELANALTAKYISIDDILDELKIESQDDYISETNFFRANKIALERAKYFLHENKPVIFDGNFYWESQVTDLVEKLDRRYYIFTLKAPLAVCIERDKRRIKPYGKEAVQAVYNKSTEFTIGTEIDATKSMNDIINDIKKLIL